MWWYDRRTLIFGLCALALTGCGFTPVHGTQGAGGRLQSAVRVQAPDTRPEQLLIQRIEERLGRGSRYRLSYDLDIRRQEMAVAPTNISTRFNLVGNVTYALHPAGADTPLIKGRTTGFTGYSTTDSTVATSAAERDAHARLATILADRMIAHLLAAASDLPE